MGEETDRLCYHCKLPVPAGTAYHVDVDGQPRAMCCRGCQAVAQAIVDGGLTDFYRYRTERSPTGRELIPDALRELPLYDKPEVQRTFVREAGANLREASLILEGIVCAACIWLNERHVNALPGVEEFRVNYSTHRATLRWDDSRIHLSEVLRAVADIGYVAHPFDPGRQEQLYLRERKAALRRLAVAGLGAMQVMMLAVALYAGDFYGMDQGIRGLLRWVSLLFATPVVLYSAAPFFTAALRDLRSRQLGMDVPVALAIGLAYGASMFATIAGRGQVYFDSVSMFAFFLLAGRFLEMGARHRAGQAAEELVKLLPAMATRLDAEGGEEVVPVSELEPGDRVRIRPGETVPADGRVLEGRSSVDEALLTGESLPVAKSAGAELVGGTLNVESPLVMNVEKVGTDTVLSSIQRLLDRAQHEKPRIARIADRVAGRFVGALLVIACAVALYWWQAAPAEALWIVLSVLVVTCPCALSLATPAAVTAATGTLTRAGVLTTRGHALETLARATHVVFDKTGTLTSGRLRVEALQPLGREGAVTCHRLAAALERDSEHPIAHALREGVSLIPVASDVRAVPGCGVEGRLEGRVLRIGTPAFVAELVGSAAAAAADVGADPASDVGWTEVLLGDAHGPLARFRLSDSLRPQAAEAVAALQAMGLQTALLSGDSPAAVGRVANELGIAHYEARLSPEGKLEALRRLQEQGAVVAMVGDGVNDAPVLAAAQVSLAMGSGTQLAQASADMILLSERLPHLVEAVDMARRTLRVVRENLGWALLYNLVAVPLAAVGMVPPWAAALGMSASSLLVVLNALRLGRTGAPEEAPPAAAWRPGAEELQSGGQGRS